MTFSALLRLIILVLAGVLLLLHEDSKIAHAQATTSITPTTGTGNLGTTVTQAGNVYNITGGTRPGNGSNLFHSFGQFNVGSLDTARFLNTTPQLQTSNILARVTVNNNPSSIFGTIDTLTYPGANLFLMNPAGFLFGPHAVLNVGGMVAFTTADYLRLTDGVRFNAMPDAAADALLSAAPVGAFGFLGSNPGAIFVQGSQLSVPTGTGISLVGGNVTIQSGMLDNGTVQPARFSAPSGQINVASVASPGEILQGNLQSAINVNGQSFTTLGTVTLSQGATLDASGNSGGTISIRSGQFVMNQASLTSNTTGAADGAPIAINVDVQGDMTLSQSSGISATTSGGGHGGDLRIVANNVTVKDTSRLSARTDGPGHAGEMVMELGALTVTGSSVIEGVVGTKNGHGGNVTITTTGDVLLSDAGTIQTRTTSPIPFNSGSAGNVTVTAPNLTLQGGFIRSLTSNGGSAGDVILNVPGTISLSGHASNGSPSRITNSAIHSGAPIGNSGNLSINAGRLTLTDGASIDISSQNGPANGSINIQAADTVMLSGGGRIFNFARNLRSLPADVGPITITAPHVLLNNGQITTLNNGSGLPGDITIQAQTLSLMGNSLIAASANAAGPGGVVQINATESITLSGHSTLASAATGTGNAGSVDISVPSLTITDGSTVSTQTNAGGAGGNVTVQGPHSPANSIVIDGAGSGIFTNTQGTGAGGNLNLSVQSLTLQNSGTLSATTSGNAVSAMGGTITVNANQVQLNSGGLITAQSTGKGNAGAITINAGSSFQSSGGTVSTTAAQAHGGDISVTTGQSVNLSNGASISASSTGPGNAGNIRVMGGNQFLMQNSSITTQAAQAAGGNIKIGASDTVKIQNSLVSASVLGGSGGGGNISIDPNFVILQNSQILARAVQGNGGNITITTNVYLPDANSIVDASSEFGVNGTVTIQSPTSQLSGHIVPLPQSVLQASSLLRQRCAAQMNGQSSSFVLAGRESLPAEPGGWLSSPLAALPAGEGLSAGAGLGAQGKGLAGEKQIVSLRRLTPAGFLTQAFADDGSAGCGS